MRFGLSVGGGEIGKGMGMGNGIGGVEVLMKKPDRTTRIGKMINEYLTSSSTSEEEEVEVEDHVIHLLFSANRWEKVFVFLPFYYALKILTTSSQAMKSAIESGQTLIIDRYYYSGMVYSAAKHIPSMPLSWCRQPDVGLPRPDLCIFLDISAEEAAKRGGYGTEKYEKKEMQDRVRVLFDEVMGKGEESEDFVRIDAGAGVEEVQQRIRDAVEQCRRRVEEGGELRVVGEW